MPHQLEFKTVKAKIVSYSELELSMKGPRQEMVQFRYTLPPSEEIKSFNPLLYFIEAPESPFIDMKEGDEIQLITSRDDWSGPSGFILKGRIFIDMHHVSYVQKNP